MKYAWIVSNKAHWSITLACEVLGVSASGYFEHGRRKKTPKPSKPDTHKRMSDEALLAHIRAIHAEALMASPNSPTRGHPKFPQAALPDYDPSAWMAKRAAASLSL